jgi:hypothetical protein
MTREEIIQMLEAVYSKADYDFLFKKAESDPEFFTTVWDIACEMPDDEAWRYLWILDHATEKQFHNLYPIIDGLYKMVLKTDNESVIRQTMKLILRCPLNEEYAGELLDRCVKWMNDPKAKISSQCLGLEFFYRTCCLYPEMVPELLAYIDDILERSPSAGYKLRLKQIRSQIQK